VVPQRSSAAELDVTIAGPTADDADSDAAAQCVPDDAVGFSVSLSNFSGPFDLLLSLISKHEMDITEVSLSKVTDEFIAYLRGLDSAEELDQASEFLVVAATLLDLKVAGLLPQGELVDAEGVALLEARDLLFARLLQYRAFKEAAQWFSTGFDTESTRQFRSVRLEEKYRRQTPELVWTIGLDDFAALAALAFAPRELPSVGLDHLHAPLVSIREQAAHVVPCCAVANR
jgi:segregation and condensation protein A